ncbi:ABC transporter ATP-binding protein [Dactylosporangium sucinum]|uniref:Dipeptide/oligopeptide/nickel ABC transporter ATP-binding protein n=1 Tax=Dactylosporangium sucinum TaxID=1424081 RepID=A0A917T336_9ACTN|nr:ABC transporter ATP-binding protein [Dactylosporangium sucinum]GGM08208.1 dipeptide/oligopeptide/nickel ABC transporter ATP-binding protein [Dactylosporangium sucinum]
MPVLRVDDLDITVAGRGPAVQHVSFTVHKGESVGLVGESGSGKTLTCRAVLGVLPPGVAVTGGRIELDGTALTGLDRRGWDRIRGNRLAAVFQDPASYLNPSLTVGRQLAEQLRLKRGLPRRAARAAAVELLAAVGIRRAEAVVDQYPHELSGGMLQRTLIAIAVAGEPELLVADEATTALDTAVQAEVLELLRRLRAERGLALLLVSHDLAVVAEVCDRIVVFYAGEVVEQGPTAEVIAGPRHPYTEALLRVASLGDWRRRELEVIPGRPPELGAPPAGCRFAERCAHATDACATPVALSTLDGDRQVRCHRAADLALVGAR